MKRIVFFVVFQVNLVFLCVARNPNVLFIIIDDLRPALSGYGDQLAKTPNIDKLMERSFYFTKAYCQQALCAPSRNSLLTGRRPDTLHLYDFYSYWRTFTGNFTTLPQYFKNNGYYTYSIGKVFHPGASSNYTDDYPFSWSTKTFHPRTETYINSPVCPSRNGTLKANIICPVSVKSQPEKTLPDIESVKEAKRFLTTRKNTSEPYFLAVGFHKPHIPFRFPKRIMKLFPRYLFNSSIKHKPDKMPDVAWNPYMDIRKRDDSKQLNIPFPFGPIPRNFRTSIRQAYYAATGYIDHLLGKLLAATDLKNTIVVLTSDHGWSLGEHAEWAKYSNFEVALRVPLIIYSPEFKLKRAVKIANIVELLDVYSTIVDLAGLPKIETCRKRLEETCTEGKSLYELMKSRRWTLHRNAFSQYPRPGAIPTEYPNSDEPKLNEISIMGYSLRTKNYRYNLWVEFNHSNFIPNWKSTFGEELYDHSVDSDENINLIDVYTYRNIAKRMQRRLIQQFS